jgi:hypothetical protein
MSDPTPINTTAPCQPWVSADGLCCELPTGEGAEALVQRCIDAASEVLHALTGRRFGVCESTETLNAELVCAAPSPAVAARFGMGLPVPARVLALTGTPVQAVTSVHEDGVELVQGVDYRVDDWRLLVRIGQAWRGEVVVVYSWGSAVPVSGVQAAGELACELLKACRGDRSCKLPSRVQDVSQRGLTVRFIDPMDFLDRGRTGLTLVDLFLTSVNPNGLTGRSRIVNPDDYAHGSGGRYRGTST